MNGVQPRQGERRDRSDRRVSGRRGGNNRRALERREQLAPVAVNHRNGDERRTGDRRTRVGRRTVGERRGFGVGD